MKKLIFSLLTILMLSNSSFGQTTNRTKLFCFTTSCCDFLIFNVDIVSTKHCYYAAVHKNATSSGNYSIQINSKEPLKEISTNEDIIMPQFKDESGNALVLPKGTYKVENNEILYTAQPSSKIKQACIEEHVTGHVLGHDVDYTISFCVYYWSWKTGKISAVVTPKLTEEQKGELLKNNNKINFTNDTNFKNEDVSFTLKAGSYIVNEDGSIYLLNAELN